MSNGVHDAERLKELQSLDLNYKIMITQARIIDWYEHYNGNVCVSFSGGKDSTVLLHIARKIYPDIPAVFSNTGLEYPEIQKFVKSFDNVDIVTPSMNFGQVITEFGYPIIGKEVAEAIYYARRIRSQSPKVERERERAGRSAENSAVNARTKASRVAGLQAEWKKLELGGGGEPPYPDINSEKQTDSSQREMANRDRQWRDWRRGCL